MMARSKSRKKSRGKSNYGKEIILIVIILLALLFYFGYSGSITGNQILDIDQCGDSICDTNNGEDSASCPEDCGYYEDEIIEEIPIEESTEEIIDEPTEEPIGVDPYCNYDGFCDDNEGPGYCIPDCSCGDGTCSEGEYYPYSNEYCLEDCRDDERFQEYSLCNYDRICDEDENSITCSFDCFCGNNHCEEYPEGYPDSEYYCEEDCGECVIDNNCEYIHQMECVNNEVNMLLPPTCIFVGGFGVCDYKTLKWNCQEGETCYEAGIGNRIPPFIVATCLPNQFASLLDEETEGLSNTKPSFWDFLKNLFS